MHNISKIINKVSKILKPLNETGDLVIMIKTNNEDIINEITTNYVEFALKNNHKLDFSINNIPLICNGIRFEFYKNI